MIITKTPFRMSFFGGGTDMPAYFVNGEGSVLSTTFDKYCYVIVRHLPRFFNYTSEISYSKIERVTDVSQIEHPAIRNAMVMLDMHELRITYEADLPARSGLGTSSSFAVGMLNAFHALKGSFASKEKLAYEAIYLERTLCNEAGGWQDQVAASYGGFNRIFFHGDSFEVRPLIIAPSRKKELDERLLLFFTGFTRLSSEVQQSSKVTDKKKNLDAMLELVDEAEAILENKSTSLDSFGRLLDETWHLKRGMSNAISSIEIDNLYERAKSAGALGGKLLGAGGGGFLLLYVDPCYRADVFNELSGLTHVPFTFEEGGTRVIHYSPEDYEPLPVFSQNNGS